MWEMANSWIWPVEGIGDSATAKIVWPSAQEAMAITMERLPLSPRGGPGAVMP